VGVGQVTKLDQDAIALARGWGFEQEVHHTPVSPCPRGHCGGAILEFGDREPRCLLCSRAPEGKRGRSRRRSTTEPAVERIMREPPAPVLSLRASVAEPLEF
jgi:hypothetical protein